MSVKKKLTGRLHTQVGRNLVRGLLDAGAMVVVNSRTASRLEHLAEILGQPDRLATVHGSLLPEKADKTISDVMNLTAQRLDHVEACVEIKILRRVRAGSSRRPPRHRRDACSMAWRCGFLTARPSQDGLAEKCTQHTG